MHRIIRDFQTVVYIEYQYMEVRRPGHICMPEGSCKFYERSELSNKGQYEDSLPGYSSFIFSREHGAGHDCFSLSRLKLRSAEILFFVFKMYIRQACIPKTIDKKIIAIACFPATSWLIFVLILE